MNPILMYTNKVTMTLSSQSEKQFLSRFSSFNSSTQHTNDIVLPHPILNNPHKSIPTFQLITQLYTKLKSNYENDNQSKTNKYYQQNHKLQNNQISIDNKLSQKGEKVSRSLQSHDLFLDPFIPISDQRNRKKNRECWDKFYSKLLNFVEYEYEQLEPHVDLGVLEYEFGIYMKQTEWNHFQNLYSKLHSMELIRDKSIQILSNKSKSSHLNNITSLESNNKLINYQQQLSYESTEQDRKVNGESVEKLLLLLYNLRNIDKSSNHLAMNNFSYLSGNDRMEQAIGRSQWFMNGQDNLRNIYDKGLDSLYSNYLFNQKLNSTPTKEELRIQHSISDDDEVGSWFYTDQTSLKHAIDNNYNRNQEETSSFPLFGRAIVDAQNSLDFHFSSSFIGLGALPFNPESESNASVTNLNPLPSQNFEIASIGYRESDFGIIDTLNRKMDDIALTKKIDTDYMPITEYDDITRTPPFKKRILSHSPQTRQTKSTIQMNIQDTNSNSESQIIDHTAYNKYNNRVLYLTELGQDALDQVYNSYFVFSKNAPYEPMTTTENDLIHDAFLAWQGIESQTFRFEPLHCSFTPVYIRLHSTSVSSIRSVLEQIAWSGSLFRRLEIFCQYNSSPEYQKVNKGIISQAFANSVQKFLNYYHSCIIKLGSVVKEILQKEIYTNQKLNSRTTLWSLSQHIKPLVDQLHFVTKICQCDIQKDNLDDSYTREATSLFGSLSMRISDRMLEFPKGAKLLTYLHYCLQTGNESMNGFLLKFFQDACFPYMQWLREWIYHGTLDENNQEFMVRKSRAFYLEINQYQSATSFWTAAFSLHEDNIPSFLAESADAIFSTGRIINVIRKYQENHYMFSMKFIEPDISILFTNQEIRKLRKQYLKLSISQKEEHQNHVKMRIEKQIQELNKLKEKSRMHQQKIKKQNEELDRLAILQAEEKRKLFEERVSEIETKQLKRLEEIKNLEEREREIAQREELEKQKAIEIAKQKILQDHQKVIQRMEKRRAITDWKFERQRLNPQRKEMLLLELRYFDSKRKDFEQSIQVANRKVNPHFSQSIQNEAENKLQEISQSSTKKNNDENMSIIIEDDKSKTQFKENINFNQQESIVNTQIVSSDYVHNDNINNDNSNSNNDNDIIMNDISNIEIDDENDIKMNDILIDLEEENEITKVNLETPIKSIATSEIQFESKLNSLQIDVDSMNIDEPISSPLLSMVPIPQNDIQKEFYDVFRVDYNDEFSSDEIKVDEPLNHGTKSISFIKSQLDIPLDQAIEESLLKPVIVQYNSAHSIALSIFFGELNLEDHFEIVRYFYLMNAGDFSEIFFKKIFDEMYYGNRWTDSHQLNSHFESTLKLTDYFEEMPLSRRLSFRIPPQDPNKTVDVHGVEALNHVTLQFEVGWPLNILFDGDAQHKYNLIFHFLVQVKRIMVELRDTWKHFTHRNVRSSFDPRIREIQMFRQEIEHFMNIMQSYLMTEVLETSFSQFMNRIRNETKSFERLYQLHQEFLNQAIKRCLLSQGAKPVKELIDSMFSVIFKFRLLILSNPLNLELSTNAFNKMKQLQMEYKSYLNQFINILRSKSQELQELVQLLTILNFNDAYY